MTDMRPPASPVLPTDAHPEADRLRRAADRLLTDPAVRECVVVERATTAGERVRIAYPVLDAPEGFASVEPRLRGLAGGEIADFVPLARLPLTDRGEVDHGALARLPVWSDDLLPALETAVSALPEVERVACVVSLRHEPARPVHVERLLREVATAAAPPRPARAAATEGESAAARPVGTGAPSLVIGGALPERPGAPATLPELLAAVPAGIPIIHVEADGSERVGSYGGLRSTAHRVLTGLRRLGCAPGDTVILQLERSEDILDGFWGCVLAGCRPVIVPVPLDYVTDSRALDQLKHVWGLFEQPLILTTGPRLAAIGAPALPGARAAAIERLREEAPAEDVHRPFPSDVAFFTLSSGSTGLPKAVMITHAGILARARGTNHLTGATADDVILNWLPFDHIGSISDWHVRCLDIGCTLVYAPKEYVLGRPLRWLDLIARHRVTRSWAPNFAYSLVTAALKGEPGRSWDLSCVKMLLTAGESVTRETVAGFLDGLAPFGLARSALQTAFGMAEMGSGVTYHLPAEGRSLTFRHVDRETIGGVLRFTEAEDPAAVAFASLGPVIPGMSMRVVDEAHRVVPEGTTGRVQFRGAALSAGYFRNPEANKVFLEDGWFDSGDVGFLLEGELMLTGRAEAGIIINGANFYNNEIEAVVEQVDGVAGSFTAACAVRPAGEDAQKLAIFFHTPFGEEAVLRKLLRAIQSRLAKQLGIKADYLIPVAAAQIPKTAIGKIQHKRLVAQFEQGVFDEALRRLDILAANDRTLPDRFHERVWRRKDPVHAPLPLAGTCLVLRDRDGLGERLVRELTAAGVACVVADGAEDPRPLLETITDLRAVVHLADAGSAIDSLLPLLQALAGRAMAGPLRLLSVTRAAQAVLPGEPADPTVPALTALLQSLQAEWPELAIRRVDLPAEMDTGEAADLLTRELLTQAADVEVAWRDGARLVAGLRRVDIATAPPSGWETPFRRGGTYLISGDLDGTGARLAALLLSRFEARLLLPGLESDSALAQRLRQAGGTCLGLPAGPVVVEAVRAALAGAEARLDGILHLMGDRPSWTLRDASTALAAQRADLATLEALAGLAVAVQAGSLIVHARATSAAGALASVVSAAPSLLKEAGAGGPRLWTVRSVAAADSTDAAERRALNALLVGLRLERPGLLIGLDEADPSVRPLLTTGDGGLLHLTAYVTADRLLPADAIGDIAVPDRFGTPVPCEVVQLREPEAAPSQQIELWPSVAEYFVYDDLIYYALASDERRNVKYRAALERTAVGKVVLDIGTGKEAILARLAVEAGARKVYAIEKGNEAYAQAVARVHELGLDDRITIIHGDASEVQLPEPADVCVSEIVGPIGGCEGAAILINDAQRFLRPGGVMIPIRSTTKIAAARLPDVLLDNPGFYRVPGSYTGKIFAEVGYPFDLRLCIKKFPADHLLSNGDIFEDLDFSGYIPPEETHGIELVIDRASRMDGFLVWLNLHTIDGEVIDILEHEYSWLPVYMPVFDPGIDVVPGDRITATISRTLCDNGHNPDFTITGQLIRTTGEIIPFEHGSLHHAPRYKAHPFYERLFRDDPMGRKPSCRPGTPLQYLPEMPLTPTGEVDLARLRTLARGEEPAAAARRVPATEIELQIAKVWQEVLGVAEVGIDDNFFELGGHSLLLVQAHEGLSALFGPRVTLVDLFKYATIRSLVEFLTSSTPQQTAAEKGAGRAEARRRVMGKAEAAGAGTTGNEIAVIGLSCRFPGAEDPDGFWRNLASGTESITFFTEEEVIASGIDAAVARNPNYVKASPLLRDVEGFDAEFFGYGGQDAALMDPQQRILLECAWEALENAGYDPFAYQGEIGVYAGASMNTYLLNNVYPNRASLDLIDSLDVTTLDSMGGFQLMVANDKDYLTTRLSYKLNLRGPSVNVQTACSTGLVVVHMACQALLSGEADMFLAAGSSVQIPQKAGHLFQEGMIVSPDGHCRAFDAQAKGTIFGSGVGVIVLKRLADAIRDRDNILAVVKGSAVNNDGGMKVGYMAPSGEGQAAVVAEALAMAQVPPETIGFVEAHGTGTEMGDPIEVNALTQAFRAQTNRTGFCALGSVKTNVGHLQIASGIVGFIKTVLALHHKAIPATLHYETPNPAIDFASSPFFVPTGLIPWTRGDTPRRAGVNSLGIGGTNAHVILEEAPPLPAVANERERPEHVLLLSARNETALAELAGRYAAHLAAQPDLSLADLCFTANTGRRPFDHRAAIVAGSLEELRTALAGVARDGGRVVRGQAGGRGRPVTAFLFTGQGSQYAGMGRALYETHPDFRRTLDRCAEILAPLMDRPLLDILFQEEGESSAIHQTVYTQPALFALEYALADLWRSWGITPSVVMGHSLGEYVAACIAGVFSLEDGLMLVAARARLMQSLPQDGLMAAVAAPVAEIEPLLRPFTADVAIAAENGPRSTVLSGRTAAVETLLGKLQEKGITAQRLKTSHAFHSPLMDPILAEFRRVAAKVVLSPPRIDLISNLTGERAGEEIATPDYWVRHLRQPVAFMTGVRTIAAMGCDRYLEIGPKPTLLGLAAASVEAEGVLWLPSLSDRRPDWSQILHSLAQLAVRGPVDWVGFEDGYQRSRIALPTYPFQRRRYWLDRPTGSTLPTALQGTGRAAGSPLIGTKLRLPALKATVFENKLDAQRLPLLQDHRIFGDIVVSGACIVSMLLAAAQQVAGAGPLTIRDLYFIQPLIVPEGQVPTVQITLTPSGDAMALKVVSFVDGDGEAEVATHVEAVLGTGPLPAPALAEPRATLWSRCTAEVECSAFFDAQDAREIRLGPSYRWAEQIRTGLGESVCRMRVPDQLGGLPDRPFHPGMLDASFGLLLATAPLAPEDTWLPFGIEAVRVHQEPEPEECWAHLVLRPSPNPDRVIADVRLFDRQDRLMMEFVGLEGRRVRRADLRRSRAEAPSAPVHALRWQVLEPSATAATPAASRWLVLADRQGLGDALARRLRAEGRSCLLARAGAGFEGQEDGTFTVDPARAEDLARLLREAAGPDGVDGVVHLWALDEVAPTTDGSITPQGNACAGALHLVQALGAAGRSLAGGLWLVTRGALHLAGDATPPRPEQMPLLGMGRTLALEYPDLRCVSVDLDPAADAADPTDLLAALRGADGEPDTAWRAGRRHVARLVEHSLSAPAVQPRADATYLITGGLGGLGLLTAEWLVGRGARHLLLLGRSKPGAAALAAIARMEAAGAQLRVAQVDVADRTALASLLAEVRATLPPLRGILHAAGTLADGMAQEQGWPRFASVFPAKLAGAWNLHALTLDLELDSFVLFSSAASLLGNQGQANYAAANAFLDGLAQHRRALGLPALSINWGHWEGIGMAASDPVIRERMLRQGLGGLTAERDLDVLARLMGDNAVQLCVARVDWRRYAAQMAKPHRILAEIAGAPESPVLAVTAPVEAHLPARLARLSEGERREVLSGLVHTAVDRVLGLHGSRVDVERPLTEQGLDSLLAVQLRNAISAAVQRPLPFSLTFNYPSVNDLVGYLESELVGASEVGTPSAVPMIDLPVNRPQATAAVSAAERLLADIDELLAEGTP